jgi:ribosomal protein S12 methylthiotransferase accessory factor YcaO
MIEMILIVAHGESWELAASRAVTDVIQQFLTEPNVAKEQLHENGTFELHYTPTNGINRSFSIPLNIADDHYFNPSRENQKQRQTNEKPKTPMDDILNSRL